MVEGHPQRGPGRRSLTVRMMVGAIQAYQATVSAFRTSPCRYLPTCSEYARVAIEAYGPWKGGWLGVRRLARCHPWGGHGFDPVPGVETGER